MCGPLALLCTPSCLVVQSARQKRLPGLTPPPVSACVSRYRCRTTLLVSTPAQASSTVCPSPCLTRCLILPSALSPYLSPRSSQVSAAPSLSRSHSLHLAKIHAVQFQVRVHDEICLFSNWEDAWKCSSVNSVFFGLNCMMLYLPDCRVIVWTPGEQLFIVLLARSKNLDCCLFSTDDLNSFTSHLPSQDIFLFSIFRLRFQKSI